MRIDSADGNFIDRPYRKPGKSVAIVGGGVAGLSAACALAERGYTVQVFERRSYLGGRASSYLHPGTGEVIDNCQHVLFGCCTSLIDLYQRIGVAGKIRWDNRMTLIEPGGRRSVLKPSLLPAPLHGLPAILGANCFTAGDKLALVRAFVSMTFISRPDGAESLSNWLNTHHQTAGTLERFWRLVIASALNADLDQISLAYAAKVIRELFLNSSQAGSMGMSTVPLSELLGGAQSYLLERGGTISFNSNIEAADWNEQGGTWRLQSKQSSHSADQLILALPFEATGKLIARMPASPAADELVRNIERFEHWPICSVHLWFDRRITELDHAVLLDRDIHWMYHKSNWQPQRDSTHSYIELVVSASREFASLSRQEAISRATHQLAEFFPAVKEARLVKSVLTKEVRATFGVPPGIDEVRPGVTSPWPNCYLAGDWVATGWPSTMESAARSGLLAANALDDSVTGKQSSLIRDIAPTGFMKLFRPLNRSSLR